MEAKRALELKSEVLEFSSSTIHLEHRHEHCPRMRVSTSGSGRGVEESSQAAMTLITIFVALELQAHILMTHRRPVDDPHLRQCEPLKRCASAMSLLHRRTTDEEAHPSSAVMASREPNQKSVERSTLNTGTSVTVPHHLHLRHQSASA